MRKSVIKIMRRDLRNGRAKQVACVINVPNGVRAGYVLERWLEYHGIDCEARHLYSCGWELSVTEFKDITKF